MIRKIIILLITANLLIPKLLFAQEDEAVKFRQPVTIDFSKHTPTNSALRSLILPGWGQLFNEQETKGYILISAAALTVLTSYLLYARANKTYEDYEKIGAKNGPLYSDYETQQNQAMITSFLAVGVWIYGVVDAYFTAKYSGLNLQNLDNEQSFLNKEGLKISCSAEKIDLVYKKKF